MKYFYGYGYGYVNSCCGLFCFKDYSTGNPSIIYNRMMCEYVYLNMEIDDHAEIIGSRFGFCERTNQFKVMRITRKVGGADAAELAVVGSNCKSYSWVGNVQWYGRSWESSPVYLNGVIHWFGFQEYSGYMVAFNFDSERFGAILPPGAYRACRVWDKYSKYNMMAGVLRGCLCIWYICWTGGVSIWVMKEYGVSESRREELAFDITIPDTNTFLLHHSSFRPMARLSNAEIVILLGDTLLSFDPRTKDIKVSTLKGVNETFGAVVLYTPSFFRLKDVVVGDNVNVLKVRPNPREELKIHFKLNMAGHLACIYGKFP